MLTKKMLKRYARCAAAAGLLLGGASVAGAQQGSQPQLNESVEAGEAASVTAGSEARAGQVVFSLEQMPHVGTRALDEMSADRLQAPGDFTRDYLVRYQGLAAAEELRERDRILREEHGHKIEAQEDEAVGADDATQRLPEIELGGAGVNE